MKFYRNIDDLERILTEDEAREQWEKEYSSAFEYPMNNINFQYQYIQITGEEAVIADVKHVIATHEPADKYKYMLLDRLRTDCEYFLGNGNRYAPNLWAGSVGTHIKCMLLLFDSFPKEDRPEWLTREKIEEYGRRMNTQERGTI